jgi:hypothetical protein
MTIESVEGVVGPESPPFMGQVEVHLETAVTRTGAWLMVVPSGALTVPPILVTLELTGSIDMPAAEIERAYTRTLLETVKRTHPAAFPDERIAADRWARTTEEAAWSLGRPWLKVTSVRRLVTRKMPL